MSYSPKVSLKGSVSGLKVSISASASTTAYSLIWPSTQGAASTVLTNDGAGNLSWVTSAASSPYFVNTFTLSSTDITNKFVTLSGAPDTPADTILTVIGGPMQSYGADFTVSGSQLGWSGLFLDGVLSSGDKLVVQFN